MTTLGKHFITLIGRLFRFETIGNLVIRFVPSEISLVNYFENSWKIIQRFVLKTYCAIYCRLCSKFFVNQGQRRQVTRNQLSYGLDAITRFLTRGWNSGKIFKINFYPVRILNSKFRRLPKDCCYSSCRKESKVRPKFPCKVLDSPRPPRPHVRETLIAESMIRDLQRVRREIASTRPKFDDVHPWLLN